MKFTLFAVSFLFASGFVFAQDKKETEEKKKKKPDTVAGKADVLRHVNYCGDGVGRGFMKIPIRNPIISFSRLKLVNEVDGSVQEFNRSDIFRFF